MKYFYLFLCCLLLISASQAGVYGELEFGDSRETVTKKLSQSPLVEQTIDNTYTARTGLNGIFKCKGKISGLVAISISTGMNKAVSMRLLCDLKDSIWTSTKHGSSTHGLTPNRYFRKYTNLPHKKLTYPALSSFKEHKMMISHVWENKGKGTILMGTGIDKNKCFLFIRYVRAQIV